MESCLSLRKRIYIFLLDNYDIICLGVVYHLRKGEKKVVSHKAFKSVSRNDDNITRGIIIYLEHVNHQRPPLRMPAKMMNSSAGWKSNPEEFTSQTLTAELPPSLSKLGRGEDLTDLKIQF